MKTVFSEVGWESCPCRADRGRETTKEIKHEPFTCIGKPEPLQGPLSGRWPRRVLRDAVWSTECGRTPSRLPKPAGTMTTDGELAATMTAEVHLMTGGSRRGRHSETLHEPVENDERAREAGPSIKSI